MRRVLVTPPNVDEETLAFLRAKGCEIVRPAKAEADLSAQELRDLVSEVDGWIIGPAAHVTKALVEAAPRCKFFTRRGVGYERLDVDAIRQAGGVAAIATGGNDPSVADAAIGLMLAVGRRMHEQHQAMLHGDWAIRVSTDLYRKCVGIIGMGRSGRAVAQRLKGFEARILSVTPRPDAEFGAREGITFTDLPTLLRESDYVSIHAPLTPATRHLIGKPELALMKREAILINTARGGLVDDQALLDALASGTIAGAGLDVFEGESDATLKPLAQALIALPQVVATPHSAASTREGLKRTNVIAAQVMVALFDNVTPPADCIIADGRKFIA
jgi:D-3-phosphoglycerate dehydrogenase